MKESFETIASIDISGYSIGGVFNTDDNIKGLYDFSGFVFGIVSKTKPHYFMGVGTSIDILKCISLRADMLDNVMPICYSSYRHIFTTKGILHIKIKNGKIVLIS